MVMNQLKTWEAKQSWGHENFKEHLKKLEMVFDGSSTKQAEAVPLIVVPVSILILLASMVT
jgi:hypothetical protein